MTIPIGFLFAGGGIEFVGYKTATLVNSSSATYALSLTGFTGGISSSLQQGDLVVIAHGYGDNADNNMTLTGTGFTEVADIAGVNGISGTVANLGVYSSVLSSSWPSSVSCSAEGHTNVGHVALALAFRGVNGTQFDVSAVTSTGWAAAQPNPGSITPSTAGAHVLAVGLGARAVSTAPVFTSLSSGFTELVKLDQAASGFSASIGACVLPWTSGAVDPALFTATNTGAFDAWAAITLAIRPA